MTSLSDHQKQLLFDYSLGMTSDREETEAEKLLIGARLKVGNISFQPSFDLLPNTVVDQYPRAGEMVNGGQAVDLFIVKAGKPTEEIQAPKNEH